MGILVICSYRPKAGKSDAVKALVTSHVAVLRDQGLATDRTPVVMTGQNGTVLEMFEWVSEEASRSAHENEAVAEIWNAMAEVADFVPLSSLEETQKPFAHFTPLA